MEPSIQYCTTSDGVSIAYSTRGAGQPIVSMTGPLWSQFQLERHVPESQTWWDSLARNRLLIRYDSRGSGLSDRNVQDFSIYSLALDLQAVIDRLQLKRVALQATAHAGPIAISFAARNPDRVSHLVLWCSFTSSSYRKAPEARASRALVDLDWKTFTEAYAHGRIGWSTPEGAPQVARALRESITPENAQTFYQAVDTWDVTSLLPSVRAPALVLHREDLSTLPIGEARKLTAGIPDSRLLVVPGQSGMPWTEHMDTIVSAIDEFLTKGDTHVQQSVPPPNAPSSLVTILFTDIEGSTALTERLGDAKARELLRNHERTVREALKAHGGSEIKTMGDGFMASFGSATKALECAVAIQKAFAEQNASLPARPEALEGRAERQPTAHGSRTSPRAGRGTDASSGAEALRVRIGLNAGEPVAEDGDLFGSAVNLAARIAGQAQGREVLVSNVVRELAAGKGFAFADRGEAALKGFEEPVRLYEVRWREEG